jgi:peroxiredoxin
MSQLVFGMVLPWLLVAIGCWLVWQLMAQNGRIILRLEAIERRLAAISPEPSGTRELSLGEPAPSFQLPNLAGDLQSLTSYAGRRVLLIFFNPHCGYCHELASDLAALPVDGPADQSIPVIISAGEPDGIQGMVEKFGLRCSVLLQGQADVPLKYLASGTPTAYLIDEKGRIASPKAVGREAILALDPHAAELLANTNGKAPPLTQQAWNITRSLADFTVDGFKTLSAEQYQQRLQVCDRCDRRRESQCLECGCYLPLKVRGRVFDCPLGKWAKVDFYDHSERNRNES